MKRSRGIIVLSLLLLGSIAYGIKPTEKTLWTYPTPGNRLEPGGSKKNTGYIAGERPGFKTWNWLIYNLGLWTDYLEDVTDTLKISSTVTNGHIGQTGNIGIGESTPTAKVHIVSTGTGAAFQIDTTQQDKAIYTSSSGVVEIASMTAVEQTVTNQTITNQTVDNIAASSAVVTNLTATNIENTQLSSDNSAIDILTSSQITITPTSAVVGVAIVQAYDEIGISINSEATSIGKYVLSILGKRGIHVQQDISNGYGLHITRDLAETGILPLATFFEDNVTSTQPVVRISNDGSGKEIEFTNAITRYCSVPYAKFVPLSNVLAGGWDISGRDFRANHATNATAGAAAIELPNGAIIISFKAFWYRDDAAATGSCSLIRTNNAGTIVTMATVDSDASTGDHSVEDTTITSDTIDNTQYSYISEISLDPNNAATDVKFRFVVVKYTITEPLP